MTAGCIDNMRQGGCAGCEHRDPCARLKGLFASMFASRPAAARPRSKAAPAKNPFLALLGEVAKAIEASAKPRGTPFRAEVERRLEPLLASGEVRIGRVARELGCSRQTLYRRLKAEGVTYEQLLDGLRRRLAIRFIRDEGLSVKEAAYRLGFSDPAAFSRAFKRWTGTSPRSMRG